jgi:dipeptidyl aminopeptidase/acylaminoacyl peptidase
VQDLATGENTRLAGEPGSDQFAPAWSHDGARIAYLSDQGSGVNQVWLMDAAGSNQRQIGAYASAGSLVHVAWTSDDAAIVATEMGADNSARMLAVPPEGGALTPYTDMLGGWPSFAGDRMAFIGEGDLGMPVVMLRMGTEVRSDVVPDSLLGGEYKVGEPCLASSGTNLALSVGQPGSRRVIAFGPYTDRPVPDIPAVGSDDGNPVWSPDETQLGVVAIDASGQSIVIHTLADPGSVPAPIALPPHDRVWYLSWSPAAGASGE